MDSIFKELSADFFYSAAILSEIEVEIFVRLLWILSISSLNCSPYAFLTAFSVITEVLI